MLQGLQAEGETLSWKGVGNKATHRTLMEVSFSLTTYSLTYVWSAAAVESLTSEIVAEPSLTYLLSYLLYLVVLTY